LQQRKKTVVAELKNVLLEKIELENGFSYKFNGSDEMLDILNSFIKTERLCCDFFVFNLKISSHDSFAWLELTGPEGVKKFIKCEIEFWLSDIAVVWSHGFDDFYCAYEWLIFAYGV